MLCFVNTIKRTIIKIRLYTTERQLSGRNGYSMDKVALFILLIGGLNWGLVGLFQFDVIAWAFGGSGSIISRILYIVVALAAIWCISLFFRRNDVIDTSEDSKRINNN